MSTAELNETSTSEEVQAYADQIAKEVETERAGEEKGDARITSEHADNEQRMEGDLQKMGSLPAEESSGRDDTADKGEEADESKGQDWLSDDLKAEVAAYGIEESELADFASREELERALRFFDRSAMEAGRKAMAEEDQSRNEKGQFAKPEENQAPKTDQSGRYEIALDKDVYDDGLVEEFTRMRDHYESRLDALESRFHEADASAEEQHFDSLVDSLGHAELFGKSGKETAKELQRREDLFVAVKAQRIGLEQLGRPTDLNESLVNRVARMVFAEDLGKKDLKNRTRKISKQSNGRQGGGATRASDPREDPRDEFDRLYKELGGH